MGFYDKLQRAAYKLIKKRGTAVILRRTVKGTHNPAIGTFSPDTLAEYNCFGLIMAMDSQAANQFYSTGTLKETSIKKTDKLFLLSALDDNGDPLGIVPDPITDELVIDSDVYDVVNTVPIEPGNIALIHYVQVRK